MVLPMSTPDETPEVAPDETPEVMRERARQYDLATNVLVGWQTYALKPDPKVKADVDRAIAQFQNDAAMWRLKAL